MAVPKLLFSQCNHCRTKVDGKSCAGCKSVHYCSKDHQAANWPVHKKQCTRTRKARGLMEKEETALRNFPGDFSCPANPFEAEEPHFGGENPFEPIVFEPWTSKYGELTQKGALTLGKLRLLLDLHALKNSTKLAQQLPQELVDSVQEHLVSDVVARNEGILQDIRKGISIQPRIDAITEQMNAMFESVKQSNKYFWPAIVDPGSNLTALPGPYTMGSHAEMQLKLQYWYEAWEETPGAIEWVKQKLQQK